MIRNARSHLVDRRGSLDQTRRSTSRLIWRSLPLNLTWSGTLDHVTVIIIYMYHLEKILKLTYFTLKRYWTYTCIYSTSEYVINQKHIMSDYSIKLPINCAKILILMIVNQQVIQFIFWRNVALFSHTFLSASWTTSSSKFFCICSVIYIYAFLSITLNCFLICQTIKIKMLRY